MSIDRERALEAQLKYALDNIEGVINETDIPSTAILAHGRALLAGEGKRKSTCKPPDTGR